MPGALDLWGGALTNRQTHTRRTRHVPCTVCGDLVRRMTMNFRDTLGMTAAGVFALSVAAGAQSQAPRPAGSASDQSNSAMNRTVTVVGCLQRDAAPGASGGGAASTNAMFKLTN